MKLTVTFDDYGVTLTGSKVVELEGDVPFHLKESDFPTVEKETGYTFKGWYTSPNCQGTKVDTDTDLSSSQVLFSGWSYEMQDGDNLRENLRGAFSVLGYASPEKFAESYIEAVDLYIQKRDANTQDAGTVSAGVFKGTGKKDSFSSSPDTYATKMYQELELLSSTSSLIDFAKILSENVHLLLDTMQVKTLVSGTAETSSSSTTFTDVPAIGNTLSDFTIMQAALVTWLATTGVNSGETYEAWLARLGVPSQYKDVEDAFASLCATQIQTMVLSAVLTTHGTQGLAGSTGIGKLS